MRQTDIPRWADAIDPRASSLSRTDKKQIPDDVVDIAEPKVTPKAADEKAVKTVSVESTIEKALPTAEAIESEVQIFVQVGAFRSQQNAQKLSAQFSTLKLGDVNVKEFALEDQPIYKVWIGPLSSVEQADKTVAKLNELGHKEYKLVFEDGSQ